MYDSRTIRPVIDGTHRYGHTSREWRKEWGQILPTRPAVTDAEAIVEGLAAYLDTDAPAKFVTQREVNRAHEAALIEDWTRTCEMGTYEDLLPEIDRMPDPEAHLDLVGPYEGTDDGCWLPLLTLEQAREHFGPDFAHNGFQIITNPALPRRSA